MSGFDVRGCITADGTMTDTQLIKDYLDGSASAFAELVRRHAGWVYAVARRRVGDAHLAEDVTQSVFLVLARKANRLRREIVLSAWLFEVTRMTVLRLQRDEVRRRQREVESIMMSHNSDDAHAQAWRAMEPILDRSVARLRDRDRQAVLLRFSERKTFAEVARAMGATEEAARKRVGRAVDRLRAMLASHVAMVPAPLLATLLWNGAAQSDFAVNPANVAQAILAEQARLSVLQLAK